MEITTHDEEVLADVDDLPAEDILDDALDVLSFGVGVGVERMGPLGSVRLMISLAAEAKRYLQKNRYDCKYIRKRLINEAENTNSLPICLSWNS